MQKQDYEVAWLRENLEEMTVEIVGNQIVNLNYTKKQIEQSYKDAIDNIQQLADSVALKSLSSFSEYMRWLNDVLISCGLPKTILLGHLRQMKTYIETHYQKSAIAIQYIEQTIEILCEEGIDYATSYLRSGPYLELSQAYLEALIRSDRDAAIKLILEAVKGEKITVEDLYTTVFTDVLHEIGRLWQKRKITVGHEHYASAVTQDIMAMLYDYIYKPTEKQYRMVGACVEGEQHEVGIRMVCDIFEMKDWNAYYLGANVPIESIVDVVKRLQPQVLVLSASLTKAILPCKEIIRVVKEVNPNLAVLVGGRAFDVDPTLWDFVNADGYSLNAIEAVSVASELIIL